VRINVDADVCGLHGQCVFAAPEIFSFDEAGDLHYAPEVGDDLVPKARGAAVVCPTAAIELGE
jgi:ferredoxin